MKVNRNGYVFNNIREIQSIFVVFVGYTAACYLIIQGNILKITESINNFAMENCEI